MSDISQAVLWFSAAPHNPKKGDTVQYTVTLSNYPTDGVVDIAFYIQGDNVNSGVATISLLQSLTVIDGKAFLVFASTDDGFTPRGLVNVWAQTPTNTIRSNKVEVTYGNITDLSTGFTPGVTYVPSYSMVAPGEQYTDTVSISNGKPNTKYTVTHFIVNPSVNAGKAIAMLSGNVSTSSSGGATYSDTFTFRQGFPKGVYNSWVQVSLDGNIVASGVLSATMTLTVSDTGTIPTPTPAPSQTPPPIEGILDGANFVATGQMSVDLLDAMVNQTAAGTSLAAVLARPQVCDNPLELVSSIQSTADGSLGKYIRENMRNTSGDETKLKPYMRHYFNAPSVAKGMSTKAFAVPSGTSQAIPVGVFTDMVPYNSTTPPRFSVDNKGVINFARSGRFLLCFDISPCLWAGAVALQDQTVNPVWRYGTSLNHEVSFNVIARVRGSLSGGEEFYDISLMSSYVLQNQVVDKYPQRINGTYYLEAHTSNFPLGNITSVEFLLVRGSWVATYEGAQDRLGFFKTTASGTADSSNYLELIEL